MNKVFLLGRLARDPEVRTTQTGKIVASFTVAVNRFGGGDSQKDSADFIPVIAWEKLGENCGNMLSKGQRVMVEGHMQVRNYEGKDGQKRWVTEVIAERAEFLDRKSTTSDAPRPESPANSFGADVDPDSEIPFNQGEERGW